MQTEPELAGGRCVRGRAPYAHWGVGGSIVQLLAFPRIMYAGRACVFADQSVCHLSAILVRKHVRSMCDPPAILVRSACFLRDPDEVHPNFYKRSCASTYLFYNTKREVALLGAVFTFLLARSLEIYLRLRREISRSLPWLLFCTAATLDSARVRSPPK